MPFTAYHFGPSGLIGLGLRKYIDIPVFVLANVIVDFEVLVINLFGLGWPVHRYCHTLLIGAAVGVVWGLVAYPLRHLFKKIMHILRIPYQTGFWKMVVSGILGVWLHVALDATYRGDVQIFWPSKAKPLGALLTRQHVLLISIACFVAALILYGLIIRAYKSKNTQK
ncbi:MAG: hypothetical protein JSV82_03795 [Planctomycetota bacterium]|nr:MAG: hypothetical protein JSV82_03795 [Planctomycetota bacterium]